MGTERFGAFLARGQLPTNFIHSEECSESEIPIALAVCMASATATNGVDLNYWALWASYRFQGTILKWYSLFTFQTDWHRPQHQAGSQLKHRLSTSMPVLRLVRLNIHGQLIGTLVGDVNAQAARCQQIASVSVTPQALAFSHLHQFCEPDPPQGNVYRHCKDWILERQVRPISSEAG